MQYKFGYCSLKSGEKFPKLGQGVWKAGDDPQKFEKEKEALRYGIDNGLILIDTAEMYGNGRSETLIGKAIQGYERSKLFIVSKCLPQNAGSSRIFKSLQKTLDRLQTTYLDLYLLHWRGSVPLAETVACMNKLKADGLIKHWGVSNFDTDDMEELWATEGGRECEVNQVLYHLGSRGIEFDLLPWMREHGVLCMAYCPIAQAGALDGALFRSPVLSRIAEAHKVTIVQILLAFVLKQPNVAPIPKAAQRDHVAANIRAAAIELSDAEWAEIDAAFPAPKRKVSLDIV